MTSLVDRFRGQEAALEEQLGVTVTNLHCPQWCLLPSVSLLSSGTWNLLSCPDFLDSQHRYLTILLITGWGWVERLVGILRSVGFFICLFFSIQEFWNYIFKEVFVFQGHYRKRVFPPVLLILLRSLFSLRPSNLKSQSHHTALS